MLPPPGGRRDGAPAPGPPAPAPAAPAAPEPAADPPASVSDWSAHSGPDGRLYYCNHLTQTASWIPPIEAWPQSSEGFPYGWEPAIDSDGKPYFINVLTGHTSQQSQPLQIALGGCTGWHKITAPEESCSSLAHLHEPPLFTNTNHLNKTTTYEDPRKDWTEEPPQPRQVELSRHPELGFGFVAGSEKPVIVRFVTEGGPSVDKLQPGDQILSINGEDVKKAPREHVIQLVRACRDSVQLTVCQPPLDNSARKSALLSAAKKAKLKSNPSRVRFAEGVVVNGSPLFPPSTFSMGDSTVPFMPNVLKVFLENGQTKSFKYDANTLVCDVVESLHQKLCIKAMEHFSLVVEHVKSLRRNKLTLLDPREPLARIAARPGSHNLRCLFRVAFVPKDACDLAQRDLVAFEYLYMQCCNDVVQERYAPELKYDIALRLAALHIHQHAISNNMTSKVTVKAIEREFGLERFVPVSLMSTMKRKELRKLIGHFLKLNHNLSPTGQKSLTSLQAKLYYLNIISELPSYGAKCFSTNIRDSNMERVILVSPKFGISQITGLRNSAPVPLAEIEQMSLVSVTREDELSQCVRIHIPSHDEKELELSLEERDAAELVLVLQGYYRLLAGRPLPTQMDTSPLTWCDDTAPPYHCQHQVLPAEWSYTKKDNTKKCAMFTVPPPYHTVHIKSNGHIPSQEITLTGNVSNVTKPSFGVDSNMNNMPSVVPQPYNTYLPEDNQKLALSQALAEYSNTNHLSIDLQDMVTMGLLESSGGILEARNEEVLRCAAELQQLQELVLSSEQYLNQQQHQQHQQQQCEESDSESSHVSSLDADAPGQLKHSDSLLLLTQNHQLLPEDVTAAVQSIVLGDTEPSESDTDSMSTPTNSPSHRPMPGYHCNSTLKPSGSSFGLHSPDNLLPAGYRNSDNIQDLLKRLQEDNTLPYNFAEGTLYLDPDIIDLTMIPPPITPDDVREEGVWGLPPVLSLPPTPFADQAPLESTLQCRVPPDTDLSLDLEAFLASVAVPPPPPQPQALPAVELTPEEIMAFIIPPPPPGCETPQVELSTVNSHHNSSTCEEGVRELSPPPEPPAKPVLEYATAPRKVGAFSCCGKYRESPESNTDGEWPVIQPPPRPPARPPKPERGNGGAPPSLPPKKPPLPPAPSQDLLKKSSQRSPVPVPKTSKPEPINTQKADVRNASPVRNGHIVPGPTADREAASRAEATVAGLLERMDRVAGECTAAQAAGGGARMDEAKFQAAKDQLTSEARQLVTASKVLVRSATEGGPWPEAAHVAACVRLLVALAERAADAAAHTTAPLHTCNLVLRVRHVLAAFREVLHAGVNGCLLLAPAEGLAAALAALLRSLRVFSP